MKVCGGIGWYVYRCVGVGGVRGVVGEAENNYNDVGVESEMSLMREEYWGLHMELYMGLNLCLMKKLIFLLAPLEDLNTPSFMVVTMFNGMMTVWFSWS